jgi:protease-4
MLGFLRWARSILLGAVNGILKVALALLILAGILAVIGLIEGDGLPSSMVLTADVDGGMPDSTSQRFTLGTRALSVMDAVLALDRAGRDSRVKGLFMRVGSAGLDVPQAEELSAAVKRFRATGKFVIADADGFLSTGLGDYLFASSANEIWMQPGSPFTASGAGAGAIFFRGLFDKIQAEPQIVKRADFKSAADQFMEKDYTPADRLQTTALLQSWYDSATSAAAAARKITPAKFGTVLQASPQFAADAKKAGLIDRIGYDDDALKAALARAGKGADPVSLQRYADATHEGSSFGDGEHVALITGSGDIVDGSAPDGVFNDKTVIAGDDFSRAVREATRDKDIKAIILRIDSPGGSVLASDQILDAVRKAQAAGKPVVVSMGAVAASGGYYISTSANRIVAEPGTITGSIGVLTGKVSFGKTASLLGIGVDQIGVGKNALFDSSIAPYTDDQMAALNHQADVIYTDFKSKVAKGRKLPIGEVDAIAKGRVWSGADARKVGLVDKLGSFWTAVDEAKQIAKIPAGSRVVFDRFPRQHGIFDAIGQMFGETEASARAIQGLATLANTPLARATMDAMASAPKGGVELRATGLPIN